MEHSGSVVVVVFAPDDKSLVWSAHLGNVEFYNGQDRPPYEHESENTRVEGHSHA